MSKTDDFRTIFYEATEKLKSEWVDRNSVLHKFTDGKGEIVLEDHVTRINNGAFDGCTSLISITIPDSVTKIGELAFSGCSSLTSIIVDDNNPTYNSRDNCNAIIEKETNTLIRGCQNTVIPKSVRKIGDHAFSGCTGLTSIIIPYSVTEIGYHVFDGCTSLESITIPDSVTEIGYHVFDGCTNLTSIVIDESNPKYDSRNNCNAIIETKNDILIQGCVNTIIPDSVTKIGALAFDGCSGLKSITIPDSVTQIGEYAFSDCTSLKSIIIPYSVEAVGKNAFEGCVNLSEETKELLRRKYKYHDF